MLLDEYIDVCKEKGEDILVLMQVGGFYEAYTDIHDVGSAKKLSRLLNIHLTRKSTKAPLSPSNPYMCGIPLHALQKHMTRLNDEGYEVMIIQQHPDNPKQRFTRGVYSSNMRMEFEDEEGCPDRKMFALAVEKYPVRDGRITSYRYLIAHSYIEMNTGRVFLQEADYDETGRFLEEYLLTYQPEEILLSHNTGESMEALHKACKVYEDKDPWKVFEEVHYFRKAFSSPDHEDDAVVFLGIHRHPLLTECLGRLLRLVQKHDPLLMDKLQVPSFLPSDHVMRFNQDALAELNVLSVCERRRTFVEKKKQKSLFDLLSGSMNIVGKRYFEKILRTPLCNASILSERYDRLEAMMGSTDTTEATLPDIRIDTEWYLLRWKRGKLSAMLLGQLLTAYGDMARHLLPHFPSFFDAGLVEALSEISKEWRVSEMDKGTHQFVLNMSSDVLKDNIQQQQTVCEQMKRFVKNIEAPAQLKIDDNGTYCIHVKPKDWKQGKDGFYETHRTKSYVVIEHSEFKKFSLEYSRLKTAMDTAYEHRFREMSQKFLNEFGTILEKTNQGFAAFSCFYPLARFFRDHGYVRPKVDTGAGRAYVTCVEFRHPIMEVIHRDDLFVPYTCSLGNPSPHPEKEEGGEDPRGYLIYGTNSSGKSTMLKSMGLCLWMAQCGLFVPATRMVFSPFDAIYSKIGTQDNLFLGQSTFVAEMNELQYILKRSTRDTFVMCDELTSGTETKSATGIVVSCLLHFLEKGLCFFFTTHLHTVARVREVSSHKSLRICHFKVETQKSSDLLIKDLRLRYDRRLHDGSGDDMYGIEVAKAVGLPASFIQQAFSYRERVCITVEDDSSRIQVSRYNKKLVLTECFLCSSSHNLHTHHITPQSEFSKQKKQHSKDGLYNLVSLCRACHEKIHHAEKETI
jgi:DNA mismatch repair protein MutS